LRHCFADGTEEGALVGIEHAARIEVDYDGQYVVVLDDVGYFAHDRNVPCQIERVRPQSREHTKVTLRRSRTLLVVDDDGKRAPVGKDAGAALDRLPARTTALENAEPTGEANQIAVSGLELRRIPRPRDGHAPNGNRMLKRVREDRFRARSWKHVEGDDRACGILRTGERKQVRDIGDGIANRPGTINVIGHSWLLPEPRLVCASERWAIAPRADLRTA
jgi:hypothetical protein